MTVDGGFAEYAVHHVSALYPLPPQLSFEDGVLITTAGTASCTGSTWLAGTSPGSTWWCSGPDRSGSPPFRSSRRSGRQLCGQVTKREGGNNVKRAVAMAAQGKLRGAEMVTHRFALEEIATAFRVVREREGDPVKVVIVP